MPFFTDLIKAFKEVMGSLKDLAKLTKKEREEYRRHFQDAYILLNTTLGMLIAKLGDTLNENRKDEFNYKVKSLDSFQDWYDAERKIGLCNNLRVLNREMSTIAGRISGSASVKSWGKLKEVMNKIFNNETDLAIYISKKLKTIADGARNKVPRKELIRQITDFRNQLLDEREKLLEQERDLITYI